MCWLSGAYGMGGHSCPPPAIVVIYVVTGWRPLHRIIVPHASKTVVEADQKRPAAQVVLREVVWSANARKRRVVRRLFIEQILDLRVHREIVRARPPTGIEIELLVSIDARL